MAVAAVLDASAVLALLLKEPGSEAVEPYVGIGRLSIVNYSEVVARLSERGAQADFIQTQISALALTIVPFDLGIALFAGMLRPATKEYGLSFADRACLATAAELGIRAVTADHEWTKPELGIEIELIRQRRG